MKLGFIFNKWIIMQEENDEYKLLKNWENVLDTKTVSKTCIITSRKFFIKKIEELTPDKDFRKKYFWEKELGKVIDWEPLDGVPYYPKVSVILANYNGEQTIENAIKSIIKQTYRNIELIVIDDCSKDKSYKKIMELKEKYIDRVSGFQILLNATNMGAYHSRNRGIKQATGDIIAIQDSDDISEKNRLMISVDNLIKHDVEFVLANGKKLDEHFEDDRISTICVTMATLVVDRKFFDKYGFYDEETRHSGDLEILDRAYFLKYGNYEFKNFWFWLNYTAKKDNFYKHIYEDLYYVGVNEKGITKTNNAQKRTNYLNNRRKYFESKK